MFKPLMLTAALLAGLACAGPAQAAAVNIPLPAGTDLNTVKVSYSCTGGRKLQAVYYNFLPQGLVTLGFEGRFLVLATVMSGSGARYAGLNYIWWTKGNTADFYDLDKGEGAPPVFSCTSS